MVPGSDPKLKDEVVIYSAHWDHLGIGTPVNGRRHLQRRDRQRHRLRDPAGAGARVGGAAAEAARSRAVPFGDGGGRRARGARNTTRRIRWFPPAKTAIDLNYDALYPWGRAKDVVITGAERTTSGRWRSRSRSGWTWRLRRTRSRKRGTTSARTISRSRTPGFRRFRIGHATEFAGKPAGFGEQAYQEYNSKHYHQPSDEFQADWDFTALQQAAEFGFLLGQDIANQERLPDWRPGHAFHR